MQKFKQFFLTMIAMGFSSIFLLLGIGMVTYFFKWQADTVRLFLTIVYIVSGFIGGIVHRKVCPRNEKYPELFQRIGGGLLVGTLYVFLLIAIAIGAFQNQTLDIGQVFTTWFLVAGSAAMGALKT